MIIYAESNFIFERVFEQDQADAVQKLLDLGIAKQIQIFYPAYAVIECFQRIRKPRKERAELLRNLKNELNFIGNAKLHQKFLDAANLTKQLLEDIEPVERTALNSFLPILSQAAQPLSMTAQAFLKAREYQANRVFEHIEDAFVLASIVEHLAGQDPNEKKLFLNRNSQDFNNRAIKKELAAYNCRLVLNFADALQIVSAGQPPQP